MTPTDAYRGAGRPEATYAIERAMDALARTVGVDPAEIRRRNYIPTDAFPYNSAAGLVFDSGDYEAALDKALELAGYDGLRKAQQARREAGDTKHLGDRHVDATSRCAAWPRAGCWRRSTTAPAAGSRPRVRLLPTGKVQVVTGTTPHGQGHETCWSMIVGRPARRQPRRRRGPPLRHRHQPARHGHLRVPVAGGRRRRRGHRPRDKVIDKARPDRRPPARGGRPTTSSSPVASSASRDSPTKAMPIQGDRLRGLHRPRPARRHRAQPRGPGHLRPAQLRVPVRHPRLRGRGRRRDRLGATSSTTSPSTTAANQINPMIVEGQVHGGIVQGVAQALFEEAVYDEDGNLRHLTLADYLVPLGGRDAELRARLHRHAEPDATRSASRASARPAPSAPPRRSSTPSSTPSAPLGRHRRADAGLAPTGVDRRSRRHAR